MHDRIGAFDVLRELGRGGMGVVHLARDTRLDRLVAIKALPEELASDPGRLERFEREARALAGLNHTNVAGIFGVEEQDGARCLVLEYVDDETLADRLDRRPLPPGRGGRACGADRGRAGGGPRRRRHPSRPQARQYQDHRGRGCQGAGLRARPDGSGQPVVIRRPGRSEVDVAEPAALADHGRGDHGHRRVHEPGAMSGPCHSIRSAWSPQAPRSSSWTGRTIRRCRTTGRWS